MRWWLARASEASLAEVPHRLREQVRRRIDRHRVPPRVGHGPLPRWPVAVVLDDAARASVAHAERQILHDGFSLLGARIHPARRTDWRVDPASGEVWPDRHGFDLDLRARDPKPSWALHRLQHLQLLALGGPDAVEAAIGDLRSWLSENPPWRGVGWVSGLEVACRVVSLLRVVDVLRERLPMDLIGAVRSALWAHGAWLARYPSIGSSAGNHRVAEAAALALLGATTDLPPSGRWLDHGRRALADILPRLILADGGGAEMAVAYQAFVVEWALIARLVMPLGAGPEARLVAGLRFLGTLLDGQGSCPRIGDDDDGVVLRVGFPEVRYVASVVGAAGAALNRPDLIPVGWVPDLRARLLGADARPSSRAAPGRIFPLGGVTVLRTHRIRVAFDHGPLGLPALAAHGHADALSVWVHVDGHPWLVGRGTSQYRGAPEVRRWERGTWAHNTVVVDGRDQSEQRDDAFLWRTRARAWVEHVRIGHGGEVRAAHDGYRRRGVVHRRQVRVEPHKVRIEDHIVGSGRHRLAILLHFDPDLTLEPLGTCLWVVRRQEAIVGRVSSERPGLLRTTPHAVRYGERVDAPTIEIAASESLPFRHVVELVAAPTP